MRFSSQKGSSCQQLPVEKWGFFLLPDYRLPLPPDKDNISGFFINNAFRSPAIH